MIIKVDVNVTAPELVESITRLALALPNLTDINQVESRPAEVREKEPQSEDQQKTNNVKNPTKKTTKAETTQKEGAAASKSEESQEREISMEEVRAKLAALSQEGKQTQVKALITEFGAKKLSDIPEEKYAALLEKAEVL